MQATEGGVAAVDNTQTVTEGSVESVVVATDSSSPAYDAQASVTSW